MANEQYPHIFLPDAPLTSGFTSPQSGGGIPGIPQKNRSEHSEFIRTRLEAAWNEVDQIQAVVHTVRSGAYLEFQSEPGFDLQIQSLEARQSGIRLLNVRQEGQIPLSITCFALFIKKSDRNPR
jgi:hypothetical protein